MYILTLVQSLALEVLMQHTLCTMVQASHPLMPNTPHVSYKGIGLDPRVPKGSVAARENSRGRRFNCKQMLSHQEIYFYKDCTWSRSIFERRCPFAMIFLGLLAVDILKTHGRFEENVLETSAPCLLGENIPFRPCPISCPCNLIFLAGVLVGPTLSL